MHCSLPVQYGVVGWNVVKYNAAVDELDRQQWTVGVSFTVYSIGIVTYNAPYELDSIHILRVPVHCTSIGMHIRHDCEELVGRDCPPRP